MLAGLGGAAVDRSPGATRTAGGRTAATGGSTGLVAVLGKDSEHGGGVISPVLRGVGRLQAVTRKTEPVSP